MGDQLNTGSPGGQVPFQTAARDRAILQTKIADVTAMYHLSDDYARCLDKACPKREDCLRWLCRDVCDRWVLMQYSLRRPGTDACAYQIRPRRPGAHEEESE